MCLHEAEDTNGGFWILQDSGVTGISLMKSEDCFVVLQIVITG